MNSAFVMKAKACRTDFNPAGTAGLGMKVVTTLAKQLGGQMTTQANPAGQGACF